MDDTRASDEPPHPTDPTANEDLDRKLEGVVEEWRAETRIVAAEQERLSEEWQRLVEDRVRPFTWLRYIHCCPGGIVIGMACVGLGTFSVALVRRSRA